MCTMAHGEHRVAVEAAHSLYVAVCDRKHADARDVERIAAQVCEALVYMATEILYEPLVRERGWTYCPRARQFTRVDEYGQTFRVSLKPRRTKQLGVLLEHGVCRSARTAKYILGGHVPVRAAAACASQTPAQQSVTEVQQYVREFVATVPYVWGRDSPPLAPAALKPQRVSED